MKKIQHFLKLIKESLKEIMTAKDKISMCIF